MVGGFGEVYVMDWGIARVQGKDETRDLRIRRDHPQTSIVHSDRQDAGVEQVSPDGPLLTMDGDVVGTPAYMPIEQAEGRVEDIGPAADVYALGAILYELLAGQMPYVRPGARVSARTIHLAVLQGPPQPLEELAPATPPELMAICAKAMARAIRRSAGGIAGIGSRERLRLLGLGSRRPQPSVSGQSRFTPAAQR